MSRYFTHCFREEEFENQCRHMDGDPVEHTAGELFRRRNIGMGDYLYVFCRCQGDLFLIGRMQVHAVMDYEEAAEFLNNSDLWEATDHVVAVPGTGTIARFDRVVPLPIRSSGSTDASDGEGVNSGIGQTPGRDP